MQQPPHNLEDDWAGLEPDSEPPRVAQSMTLYAGLGMAVLLGLVVCGVAAYFAWTQLRERAESPVSPPALEVLPTESPDIAPTNTLPATAVASSIPSGNGAIAANFLPAPPAIDGDLNEWPASVAATSSHRVFSVESWDGTADVTAVWQLGWDTNNLYVGVTITDDTHVQIASGNQIFRGDSVDMQFDTDRDADYGPGLSPDDFQITLSPGDFAGREPTAFRYRGTASGAILDAPGGTSVILAAASTDSGYILEAAIPWSDLDLTPNEGLTIGLALNANDNDTPDTAEQEVMVSNMPNRTLTDPTTWGTLTLK